MRIIYSFNKKGYEGECWEKEIQGASNEEFTFIPFNHQHYLNPFLYQDAVSLDVLYRARDPRLIKMYQALESCIRENNADAIIVANCPPYHPDFLRKLDVYKVLYSADDPGATYMINIPYLHAYNHVFFVAPAYSADMDMTEKMHYAGIVNADWLPISVFDFEFDSTLRAEIIKSQQRDIDVIYIGSFWRQKVETLVEVKKALGRRFNLYGYFRLKHNVYLNVRYGFGAWVRPVSYQQRVQLYQRAKIGFNIHWDEYGLGNQRLYHLPANGVMQVCDCGPYLDRVFETGKEIAAYNSTDELIDKLKYYLDHDQEREAIAIHGYKRAMKDYRFATVTRWAGKLIKAGMERGIPTNSAITTI